MKSAVVKSVAFAAVMSGVIAVIVLLVVGIVALIDGWPPPGQRDSFHDGRGWCSITYVDDNNKVVGVTVRKIVGNGLTVSPYPHGATNEVEKCVDVLFCDAAYVHDNDLDGWPKWRHGGCGERIGGKP